MSNTRSIAMLRAVCALAMVTCACAQEHDAGRGEPVTVTPSGAIRGSWMKTRRGRGIEAYRGIRYAESPTGELRFEPPKPILEYASEVDATTDGPACPQPVTNETHFIDEDCLRLNVYTPKNRGSELLPVVVFIHGGSFAESSARSDEFSPRYLLDRDLVFVTLNYRLGPFGFISTGDEYAPGNNGFKDQVLALKWVQKNIQAFGGDPDLVTITGVSAGSFAVMLHTVSPMSKGLFHRAVCISGSPISQVEERYDLRDLAQQLAQLVGCPTNSSEDIIACLRTKPWREIGDTFPQFKVFGIDPILVWRPVIELDFGQERFLAASPLQLVQQGRMHDVPFIISHSSGEFFFEAFTVLANASLTETMDKEWERIAPISFLLPKIQAAEKAQFLRDTFLNGRKLVNDTATAIGLGGLYRDSIIGFGAHRLVNLLSRHSSRKVWYYQFAYVGNHSYYEDPETHRPIIAAHGDDVIYQSAVLFPEIEVSDSTDSLTVDRMTAILSNFAKHGDPNPPAGAQQPELAVRWPAFRPDARRYLRVGAELSVHANMFEDRYRYWDWLYPIYY